MKTCILLVINKNRLDFLPQ